MATARKSTVPGHPLWRARTVRDGHGRAVRARHRIWVWQTVTVETRDLRYGYEAIARYLSGGHAGYRVIDRRRPTATLGRTALGRRHRGRDGRRRAGDGRV